MQKIKTINVKLGQSIWDIAIQEYKTPEGVILVLQANPGLSITDDLNAGQELLIWTDIAVNQVKEIVKAEAYASQLQGLLMQWSSLVSAKNPAPAEVLNEHVNNKENPHQVTKDQVGLSNVDNTSDEAKPISTATQEAITEVQTNLDTHDALSNNPHAVTKEQVGLGNVDNTTDLLKPISTATQEAITEVQTNLDTHEALSNNPHAVTKEQVGLSNVDNTSDEAKPISTATQEAITDVQTNLDTHEALSNNPHAVTKEQVGLGNVDNTTDLLKPISTATQAALNNKLETSLKGVANGLAELDASGFVKNTQLPSYVDDVLEFASSAVLPVAGESGKIYITVDDGKTWRWSGTVYAEISASLALGETSATAYRGDRGKQAYDHSITKTNPHEVTKLQVGLSNADNTSDANKPISTATQTAFDLKVDKVPGKGLSTADFTQVEKDKLAAISGINTGDQPRKFKSYTVLLSQVAVAAPTAVALNDEVTGVALARTAVGTFTLTKVGAFLASKTLPLDDCYMDIAGNYFTLTRTSDDVMTLKTYAAANIAVLADGVLNNRMLDLQLYL